MIYNARHAPSISLFPLEFGIIMAIMKQNLLNVLQDNCVHDATLPSKLIVYDLSSNTSTITQTGRLL